MALVDIENPVAIRDVRLLGLFQVWHSKLTGQRLPTSGDMDPKGLARWANNLMLIDVPGDVLSFRIRSVGARIEEMFVVPRAGTGLEAMTSGGERQSVLPQYRVVLDTGMPAYYETEVEITKQGVVQQRKLILPLSDDGKRVDGVLAGIYFDLPRKPRVGRRPVA